jgi:long-chain acyl-CoA synthetase
MNIISNIRRAAQINGKGTALLGYSGTTTWSEFVHQVSCVAGGLSRCGVKAGDRVAILSQNSPEYLLSQYAILWMGAVVVPLNYRFAKREVDHVLANADVKCLIVDPAFSTLVSENGDRKIIWLGGTYCADPDQFRFLLESSPVPEKHRGALEAVAGIYFTGGTTGFPKGVTLTDHNFSIQAHAMAQALRLEQSSVYLHATPMFHIADSAIGYATSLAAASHSFLAKFTAVDLLRQIVRDRITNINLVPTMLSMVLDEEEKADTGALQSLRTISYGAAPISSTLLERLVSRVPNVEIRQFYGMTELCGAVVTLAPEDHGADPASAVKMRSAGRAMRSAEIRIVAKDGGECPPGVVGEIVVGGPQVMKGYWADPVATDKAIRDGWLHSGDVGSMDEDGYVTIHDRTKDMIITGGENVFSLEVENALVSHPAVVACAVIGLPDEVWGERVHAVVVVAEDHDKNLVDALDSHVRQQIAAYKAPRSWDVRHEPLPVSGVGKIQKALLRDEAVLYMAGFRSK